MGLNNDDIKQLIAILQKGLTDTDSDEPTKNKKDKNIKQQKNKQEYDEDSIINTKSVKKRKAAQNKFLNMGVKDLHKEDVAIDKLLNNSPPTARSREFSPIDVVCRTCGKRESISPSLLHDSADRYKCNKCSVNPG